MIDIFIVNDDRGDVHIERLAAVRQPCAHGLEVLNALNALDDVLDDDLLVLPREEARSVQLAACVVATTQQLADRIERRFLGHISPGVRYVGMYSLPFKPGKTWIVIVGNSSQTLQPVGGEWEIYFALP